MPRYLDPKNDLIFKKVFGKHKDLCISLLNSLLPLDSPIATIEYDATELVPDIPELKDSIVDVRCTDQNGRRFIVEMQMQWTDDFKQRVLFNASKVYVMQLEKSRDYELLQPVYSLNLVNKEFDNTTNEFYHHYKIVNIADTEKQIKGLEFVYVELPKFKPQNVTEKKLMALWLRYLTEMENLEKAPPELLENGTLAEAVRQLEESSYTKAELATYDRIQDSIRKHVTLISGTLREGRAAGLKEGRAAGLKEGRAAGLKEGYKKGEAERQKLAKDLEAKDTALESMRREMEEMKKRMGEHS